MGCKYFFVEYNTDLLFMLLSAKRIFLRKTLGLLYCYRHTEWTNQCSRRPIKTRVV